jgi:hypothetical protein
VHRHAAPHQAAPDALTTISAAPGKSRMSWRQALVEHAQRQKHDSMRQRHAVESGPSCKLNAGAPAMQQQQADTHQQLHTDAVDHCVDQGGIAVLDPTCMTDAALEHVAPACPRATRSLEVQRQPGQAGTEQLSAAPAAAQTAGPGSVPAAPASSSTEQATASKPSLKEMMRRARAVLNAPGGQSSATAVPALAQPAAAQPVQRALHQQAQPARSHELESELLNARIGPEPATDARPGAAAVAGMHPAAACQQQLVDGTSARVAHWLDTSLQTTRGAGCCTSPSLLNNEGAPGQHSTPQPPAKRVAPAEDWDVFVDAVPKSTGSGSGAGNTPAATGHASEWGMAKGPSNRYTPLQQLLRQRQRAAAGSQAPAQNQHAVTEGAPARSMPSLQSIAAPRCTGQAACWPESWHAVGSHGHAQLPATHAPAAMCRTTATAARQLAASAAGSNPQHAAQAATLTIFEPPNSASPCMAAAPPSASAGPEAGKDDASAAPDIPAPGTVDTCAAQHQGDSARPAKKAPDAAPSPRTPAMCGDAAADTVQHTVSTAEPATSEPAQATEPALGGQPVHTAAVHAPSATGASAPEAVPSGASSAAGAAHADVAAEQPASNADGVGAVKAAAVPVTASRTKVNKHLQALLAIAKPKASGELKASARSKPVAVAASKKGAHVAMQRPAEADWQQVDGKDAYGLAATDATPSPAKPHEDLAAGSGAIATAAKLPQDDNGASPQRTEQKNALAEQCTPDLDAKASSAPDEGSSAGAQLNHSSPAGSAPPQAASTGALERADADSAARPCLRLPAVPKRKAPDAAQNCTDAAGDAADDGGRGEVPAKLRHLVRPPLRDSSNSQGHAKVWPAGERVETQAQGAADGRAAQPTGPCAPSQPSLAPADTLDSAPSTAAPDAKAKAARHKPQPASTAPRKQTGQRLSALYAQLPKTAGRLADGGLSSQAAGAGAPGMRRPFSIPRPVAKRD